MASMSRGSHAARKVKESIHWAYLPWIVVKRISQIREKRPVSNNLNPEKALIFRIIHRDNIPWVFQNGLHCRNSDKVDPNYVEIGNPELIDRRSYREVTCAPNGTLSDYVPFYFTPFSPMLYNIKTGYGGIRRRGNDEIVILASSLHTLKERNVPFVFTDRHAYVEAAQFSSNLERLDQIDWTLLQNRDFRRDPEDPGKVERYQSEALVYKHLPADALLGIACYNESVATTIKNYQTTCGLKISVATRPTWYF